MKRVLVIDDEPVIRALVTASLETAGCHVESAGDGPAGLEAAHACRPDLILLDVALPGLSGGEVLRRLRANGQTARVPVLMLTGLEPPEGLSPQGVLRKPFTPALLLETVSPWLRDSAD